MTKAPASSASAAKAPGATKDNPVTVGRPIVLKDAANGDMTITVTGVSLDASEAVAAKNQFNDPPAPGTKFVMVALAVTYKAGTEKQVGQVMTGAGFSVFGATAKEIRTYPGCGVLPDELDTTADLLDGGSVTGNICFNVPDADLTVPLLLRTQEQLCFSNCDQGWVKLS